VIGGGVDAAYKYIYIYIYIIYSRGAEHEKLDMRPVPLPTEVRRPIIISRFP
jgi:hypothetical protein